MKRGFDIFVSFFGLLILAPVTIIIDWKIRKNLGAPLLFKQVRTGKGGQPFEMIKFRTMFDVVVVNGHVLCQFFFNVENGQYHAEAFDYERKELQQSLGFDVFLQKLTGLVVDMEGHKND